MIFNSITFAVFLVLFFLLYWYAFDKRLKLQNFLILVGSYLFYGWWDWRFLSLLVLTTLSDYASAIYIEDRPKYKKAILGWTLLLNLGLLGFFKYYNFFIDSFFYLFGQDIPQDFHILKIILPVGISFYTFQSIAYVIDVYRVK
jgi:alginate O-acetyltransferase complex protein AlgI